MTRIFLLTLPESFASGVLGPADLLATDDNFLDRITGEPQRSHQRFHIELVGQEPTVPAPFGRAVSVDRLLADAEGADVIYVPPLALPPDQTPAFHPEVLEWLRREHGSGALICAACTGTLLMGASGILDGEPATTHWAYSELFRRCYPRVELQPQRTLVVGGEEQRLVTAGAHASWHDLMLFLIHRFAGAAAARKVAKVFLLDWHDLDQSAYACFRTPLQHGDEVILGAQQWLAANVPHASPVEAVVARSGLPPRSFLRRFRQVTGHTPLRYVQQLRIDRAKTLLEESDDPVESIAAQTGYEDAPYFRRLFKRTTGMTPAEYRRSFRTPANVAALLE